MSNLLDAYKGYFEAHSRFATEESSRVLPVITISRETGAGALSIASLVAKQLTSHHMGKDHCPWTVFDQNLVEKVLEDHELPATARQFVKEDASLFNLTSVVEELLELHPSDWTMVQHTTDTILRLARLGNVIFVGRGANLITKNFPSAFHVRLVAPREVRIDHIAEYYRLTHAEAVAHVNDGDRARKHYVERNFHAAIDDPLEYHVTINTAQTTFEGAAKLITDAVLGMK